MAALIRPARHRLGACALICALAGTGTGVVRADDPAAAHDPQESPPPAWRRLSVPVLGARLRALAVAPGPSGRIYLGTDQGTILISDDRGATFREVDITFMAPRHPSVAQPALTTRDASAALLPLTTIGAQSLLLRPNPGWMPYMNVPSYQALPLGSWPMGFTVRPQISRPAELINGPYTMFFPASGRVLDSLLDWPYAGARPRRAARSPAPSAPATRIESIALCEGAEFSVLALTSRELFGSNDAGETFVPLFALPDGVGLQAVTCSSERGIAVDTSAGGFASQDGGLTFEPKPDAPFSEEAPDDRAREVPPEPPDFALPGELPAVRVVSAASGSGQAPSLWAITEKELFSTAPPSAAPESAGSGLRAWARRRLRTLPGLGTVTTLALARRGLLGAQVASCLDGWTTRNLAPRADASLAISTNSDHPLSLVTISDPLATSTFRGHLDMQALLTLTWFLPEVALPFDQVAGFEIGRAQRGIEPRRRALEEMLRDAYDERAGALEELANGSADAFAALTAATRVEVLDALLDHWTSPLESSSSPTKESP